jgi:formiminotetrahydrofolate cyclodeaminase
MVARLTIGKEGYEDLDSAMRAMAEDADRARQEFLTFADRDAEAFDEVMRAVRMPKGTDEERASRSAAMAAAFAAAADVPLRVARLAVDLLDLAAESIRSGNANAASDGAAGAQMLAAAARSAIYNVEINIGSIRDASLVERLRAEIASLEARAGELADRAGAAFHDRAGA